jgi:hypothetical protein
VKILRFWSKKKTFNFCGFFFLRIEILGTEKLEVQWPEPVSLTYQFAFRKLNTEPSNLP